MKKKKRNRFEPDQAHQERLVAFKTFLTTQRGLAGSSIRAYEYDLGYYFEWLQKDRKKLEDIGPKDLDRYVQFMRKELELGARTCKRRVAAISTFYKWMVREGITKNDPVYYIELPKAPGRLPVYLDEAEVGRFCKLLDDEASRRPIIGVRNRALFLLMMYGGLRISEVLSIRTAKISFRDGYPVMVTIIGKGDKERQVPLNADIARAVLAWMEIKKVLKEDEDLARKFTRRAKVVLNSDFLFPGENGDRGMNKYTVQQKLQEIRKKHFPDKKLTPHKLRHTFATMLFKNKVDIKTIQELLGHASIATTQIYTHVEDAQMREAVMKLGRK